MLISGVATPAKPPNSIIPWSNKGAFHISRPINRILFGRNHAMQQSKKVI